VPLLQPMMWPTGISPLIASSMRRSSKLYVPLLQPTLWPTGISGLKLLVYERTGPMSLERLL
jgi:hypothetical protein